MFPPRPLRPFNSNGLLAWYPVSQAVRASGVVQDMSGNCNHAVASPSLKINPSPHGGAFQAGSGYYSLPVPCQTFIWTWAIWYFPLASGSPPIMGTPGATGGGMTQSTLTLRLFVFGTSLGLGGTMIVGAWNHLAFRYNDTTGAFGGYVNGVRVITGASVKAMTLATVSVGLNTGGTASYPIADAHIYGRELSDAEVYALYQNGLSVTGDLPLFALPVPPAIVPSRFSAAMVMA